MKRACWLILVGLLLGCGSEAVPTKTAVATLPLPTEAVAAAEVVPTATAVRNQPADTPRPTTISPTPPPPATRRPLATALPEPPDVPDLVWLPYATGNFGQPVLMLEDGDVAPRPLPIDVEIFFDYEAGWLAYGSKFWGATANQQSVTDLHIYNFATGIDQLWDDANIGRAAFSPAGTVSGQPTVALTKHNGRGFGLIVKWEPDTDLLLVEDVAPYFSWSPDGSQIAYLRDNELFVTSSSEDSGNPPIASGVYQNSQWIGDAPLWLGDSGYLLYADAPFTIVAIDGSETIVPVSGNDVSLDKGRPLTMLYSSTHNQLIAETEGMFGSGVVFYQFEDGFATAVIRMQIADAQLAGWFEEDESVVLFSRGFPMTLPLTLQE